MLFNTKCKDGLTPVDVSHKGSLTHIVFNICDFVHQHRMAHLWIERMSIGQHQAQQHARTPDVTLPSIRLALHSVRRDQYDLTT